MCRTALVCNPCNEGTCGAVRQANPVVAWWVGPEDARLAHCQHILHVGTPVIAHLRRGCPHAQGMARATQGSPRRTRPCQGGPRAGARCPHETALPPTHCPPRLGHACVASPAPTRLRWRPSRFPPGSWYNHHVATSVDSIPLLSLGTGKEWSACQRQPGNAYVGMEGHAWEGTSKSQRLEGSPAARRLPCGSE